MKIKWIIFYIVCGIIGLSVGISAYSTYGAPSEFGNESLTTCYIGGDDGIVNCTGNITGSYFVGDGSLLNVNSSIWWADLTGWVSGWFENVGDELAFNETKLNETGDMRWINKLGDSFEQQNLQLNFSFSNTSLEAGDNFARMIINNKNLTGGAVSKVEVDNSSISMFATGSDFFIPALANASGLSTTNTDIYLSLETPGKSIYFSYFNGTGIDNFLEMDSNTGYTYIADMEGHVHNLNLDAHNLDEIQANIFLSPLTINTFTNITGDYINISTTVDENISVNIGSLADAQDYILDYQKIILELTSGTNATPILNRVYMELIGEVPTWTVSITEPTVKHAMASKILIGDSGTFYGASLQEDGNNGFIKRVQRNSRKTGLIYESGFDYVASPTDLEIDNGSYINGIYDNDFLGTINITDGFFDVRSDGEYVWINGFDEITEYSDGETIGTNKYFNVIFGIIPYDGTGNVYAVIQSKPNVEYTSINLAWADSGNTLAVYPSENFLKVFFIPVVRMIIKEGDVAQVLPTNGYAIDYRGGIAGGISSGGGINEVDPVWTADKPDYVPYSGATGNLTTSFDIIANKFYGLFNWTIISNYLTFDGATLTLNDVLLNNVFNQTDLVTNEETSRIGNDTLNAKLSGGNSFTDQQDFNGDWTAGGVSIIGGDIFAQTGYFYNLTGLSVDSLRVNGSLYPQSGFDDTFEVGNETLRWNRGVFGTGDSSFAGKVGIGTDSPGELLEVSNTIGTGSIKITGQNGNLVIDQNQELDFIYHRTSVGSANMDFQGLPVSPGQVQYRFGLQSGSTGENSILLFKPNSSDIFLDIGTSGVVFNQQGDDADFRVEGNTDVNLFKIDAGLDKVGIGEATPSRKLEVFDSQNIVATFKSSGTGGGISFQDATTTADNYVTLLAVGNDFTFQAAGGGEIVFKPSAVEKMRVDTDNLTLGQATAKAYAQDALIYGINFYNSDASSSGPQNVVNIKAHAETSTGAGGYLTFGTNTGLAGEGTDPVEKMRIEGGGNVGIGTISPGYLLDVAGTFRSQGISYISQSSSAGANGLNSFISIGTDNTAHDEVGGNGGTVNIASGGEGGATGDGNAEGGEGGTVNMVVGGGGSDNDASDGTVNIGSSTVGDATLNLFGDFIHTGSYSLTGTISDSNSAVNIGDDLIVSSQLNVSGTGLNVFSGGLIALKNSGIGTTTPGIDFLDTDYFDGLTFEVRNESKARMLVRSNAPVMVLFEEDGPVNARAVHLNLVDGIFSISGENDSNVWIADSFHLNLSTGNIGIGTGITNINQKLTVVGDINITGSSYLGDSIEDEFDFTGFLQSGSSNFYLVYGDTFSCDTFCNAEVDTDTCTEASFFNPYHEADEGGILCSSTTSGDKWCSCDG